MITKRITFILAIFFLIFFSVNISFADPSGDSGGSVNQPSGCAVQKCEMLTISSVSLICPTGIKAVIKDSRGMPVQGASVFIGGRFIGSPSRTTDENGEAIFEKGFVDKQRYTLSASKSGSPGYNDLYGYQAPSPKNFVFGEGEFSCQAKTEVTPAPPPPPPIGYCESDDTCAGDEFCKDNNCTVIKDKYNDSCSRIENHKLVRRTCCDNYDITIDESAKVGDFVPIKVEQCSKPVAGKDITISYPDGHTEVLKSNLSGFGIVAAKSGEYSVFSGQGTPGEVKKKIAIKEEEVKQKSFLAFLEDPLIRNSLIGVIVVAILALLYFKTRGRKDQEVFKPKEEFSPPSPPTASPPSNPPSQPVSQPPNSPL